MSQELLKTDNLSEKLISKWWWVYFFIILTAPIGYILRVILSNTISVEELGMFYGAFWLISLLYTYNDLGLTEALQYFIPKYRIAWEKEKIKLNICISFFMQMFMGILIFCALYFWSERIALHHFQNIEASRILQIMAFYFLWYNVIQLCSTIFVAFQDTCSQGATDFTRQLGILIFTIFFWTTNSLDVETYSYSRLCGVWMGICLWLILLFKKYHPLFKKIKLPKDKAENKITLKKHFHYALLVFLTANITTILGQIDLQIVVNILGNENAGYFTNFQSLLGIFNLVANSILPFIFPLTTELISRNEKEKFTSMKTILYTYFGWFALFVSGFFLLLGKEIAVLLFSEAYTMSGTLIQIVAPCFIFNSRFSISFSILAGLGLIKKRFFIVFASLLANLLLNYFIIIKGGQWIERSGIIMGITWIIMGILSLCIVQKQGRFPIKWGFLLKNFIFITVIILIFQFGKQYLPFWEADWKDWLLILWILILYSGLVFGGNYREMKSFGHEIKQLRKK